MISSFEAVVGHAPRALILGSIPSRKSLEQNRYYAHPQNAFWPIMDELFGPPATSGYDDRLAMLTRSGVALWDVLSSADRPQSSLDSAIQKGSEKPNDICGLLDANPTITHIFFNGAAAANLFERHVKDELDLNRELTLARLPSTSPANAALSREAKLEAWKCVRRAALPGDDEGPSEAKQPGDTKLPGDV